MPQFNTATMTGNFPDVNDVKRRLFVSSSPEGLQFFVVEEAKRTGVTLDRTAVLKLIQMLETVIYGSPET